MQWVLCIWLMAINLMSQLPQTDAFGSNTRNAEPWQEKPEVPIATWVMKWAGGAPPLGALQELFYYNHGLSFPPYPPQGEADCVNASSCWMSQSRTRKKSCFASWDQGWKARIRGRTRCKDPCIFADEIVERRYAVLNMLPDGGG